MRFAHQLHGVDPMHSNTSSSCAEYLSHWIK